MSDHQDNISEKDGKASVHNNAHTGPDTEENIAARQARGSISSTVADRARRNMNAKLANPLHGYSFTELQQMGRDYAKLHAIAEPEDIRAFELGAVLAQTPEKFDRLKNHVTAEEMDVLQKEFNSRWSQPKLLYLVIVLCSTCAAVQGMLFLYASVPRGS
jgi:hypothetical protein